MMKRTRLTKRLMTAALAAALVFGTFAGSGSFLETHAENLEFQSEFNETIKPFLNVSEGFERGYANIIQLAAKEATSAKKAKESDELPQKPFLLNSDVRSIVGKDIVEGEPNYIGHYYAVVLEGLGSETFESYLSEYISDYAQESADEFLKGYNEFREEVDAEEDEEFKTILAETVESYWYNSALYAVTTSDNYYALADVTEMYSGGAHGGSYVRIFNIDASKKKLLTISDLFKTGVNWRDEIDGILAEMSATDEYMDLLYTDSDPAKLANEADFYLTDGNLVIFFQPYDIGPYSSGYIVFEIPFGEISFLLKDEYINGSYKNETGKSIIFLQ